MSHVLVQRALARASTRNVRLFIALAETELLARAAAQPPTQFQDLPSFPADQAPTHDLSIAAALREPSGLFQAVPPPSPASGEGNVTQDLAPVTEAAPPPRFPPPLVKRHDSWDPDDEWSEKSRALDEVLDSELGDTTHGTEVAA